jgi:hypothetical protein
MNTIKINEPSTNRLQLPAADKPLKEDCQSEPCSTLNPYQKVILNAPKYSAISGAKKAVNASPWRHIGELGEIAYMEDGSRRWTLKSGWEDMRVFLVYLSSGEVETHFAYIDDGGTLCDHNGDDVGWLWCDAEYFMDLPARPSLSNARAMTPATESDHGK